MRRFCFGIAIFLGLFLTACSTGGSSPSDAQKAGAYFEMGMSSYLDGRYPDALDRFATAYKLDPRRYDALMHLGLTYMKMEKLDEAESETLKACKAGSPYPECWNNLSWIYLKRHDGLRAIDAAQKALETNTYQTPEIALANLAQAYLMVGKTQEAKTTLEKAIRFKPEACSPRVLLAKAWYRLGEAEEALRTIKTAVTRCPLSPETHLWQAFIYYKLGQRRSAQIKYLQIIELFKKGEVVESSRLALERLQKKQVLQEPSL